MKDKRESPKSVFDEAMSELENLVITHGITADVVSTFVHTVCTGVAGKAYARTSAMIEAFISNPTLKEFFEYGIPADVVVEVATILKDKLELSTDGINKLMANPSLFRIVQFHRAMKKE